MEGRGSSIWSRVGFVDEKSQIRIALMRSRIRMRIRINVMRIRIPGLTINNVIIYLERKVISMLQFLIPQGVQTGLKIT